MSLNIRRFVPTVLKGLVRPVYYSLVGSCYSVSGRKAHAKGADRHRAAIICPTLRLRADAVTNDAIGMQKALACEGVETDVYVATTSPDKAPGTSTISARLAGYGLVIDHYMASMPHLTPLLKWPTNVVLKYHNITPGCYFRGYSDEYRTECDNARAGLPDLLRALPEARLFADSEFNRKELLAMGARQASATVVPPFHHVDALLQLRPASVHPSGDVLAVGRVVPNKGFETMLAAFARVAKVHRDARLHIVGTLDQRLAAYHERLRRMVDEYRLADRVIFHGAVAQETLAQLYAACACFWTCSQHEGFCVPVVEAMAFGKPIVSTPATALPETCGDAAMFASTEGELADAVVTLLSNPGIGAEFGRRARRRYEEEFAIERISQRFKAAIGPYLPAVNR